MKQYIVKDETNGNYYGPFSKKEYALEFAEMWNEIGEKFTVHSISNELVFPRGLTAK